MYSIKNTVITAKEERQNLKRNASIVIYAELIRYITAKHRNVQKTAQEVNGYGSYICKTKYR